MEGEAVHTPLPVNNVLAVLLLALLGVLYALYLKKSKGSKLGLLEKPQVHVDAKGDESLAAKETDSAVIRILYGTQTGTAERFSKQLAGELRKRFADALTVVVEDLENYKNQQLSKEKLVVFIMATYGDGEPTDNAADFYSWLVSQAEEVDDTGAEPPLMDVHFAVFGLGNKQYEHFNAVGKKVFKSMTTLGATAIASRGDGDDDDCIDDDFDKWCEEFYQGLSKSDLVRVSSDLAPVGLEDISVPAYDVEVCGGQESAVAEYPHGSGTSGHDTFWATVSDVRELYSAEAGRSCVHVELDLGNSSIKYQVGDHLGIYPQNSSALVEEVAALLGMSLDTIIKLTVPPPQQGVLPAPFPSPITIRTALTCFADLTSSPHRDALMGLAVSASNAEEAGRLMVLGSLEGKQQYHEYIADCNRSLVEVLRDFPSAKPSLGVFFGTIAPRLQARFYSISSSPKAHPSQVHVTCAVVRNVMPTGRVHDGVCSSYLQHVAPGGKVPVFWRASHFKLPMDPATPIVMVGPGTGLAPFRGFLQEREHLIKSGVTVGPAHLFFGCRNRLHDYLYEEELKDALMTGALSELHVAFSREHSVKDYVQHHMEKTADRWYPLLTTEGGHLYVCGDAKNMAKDVHRTLIRVIQTKRRCSGTEAEGVVKELQDGGRYQRDVW